MTVKDEKEMWQQASQLYQNFNVVMGPQWSKKYRNDPVQLGIVLSRYKLSAKMACKKGARVLELACGEGLGAYILGEHADQYVGVEADADAIRSAQQNLADAKYSFLVDRFMGKKYGDFSSVVSLNTLEHISRSEESLYFDTIVQNLTEDGICLVGTANVNAVEQHRLRIKNDFHQVFVFGMSDEVVHTTLSASNYVIYMGFFKK